MLSSPLFCASVCPGGIYLPCGVLARRAIFRSDMNLLVKLMRTFHLVVGITPPSKENERLVTLIWAVCILGMFAMIFFLGRELVIGMLTSNAAH